MRLASDYYVTYISTFCSIIERLWYDQDVVREKVLKNVRSKIEADTVTPAAMPSALTRPPGRF